MRDLSQNVVLVVGANGGLGRAISSLLSARGATLALTVRRPEALAVDASQELIVGDMTAHDFARAAIARTLERFGKVDGVINLSGVVAFGALTDVEDPIVAELFAVNVVGAMRLMRAFAEVNTGGFFVSVSGAAAETPFLGLSAYGASKAALSMATRSFAMESRRKTMTVIDARPPHTETELSLHPLFGTAPRMPKGLLPAAVAERIIQAIENDEREVPAAAFRA